LTTIFLHGLDSSGHGTKASWFRKHFPAMLLPDFRGSFAERMQKLHGVVSDCYDLVLIGSSFGGLMAAVLSLEQPRLVKRLILLAPALNFPEFADYHAAISPVPTLLYIGRHDSICPPAEVLPIAIGRFTNLTIFQTDDDHLLRRTFSSIDWHILLAGG